MSKLIKIILVIGISAVLWLGSIFILYNSYTNSHVKQLQVRNGMVVTDKNGNAMRMTFWQEKAVLILLSSVLFIGGGSLIVVKVARSE
jgi:hypothetical protein